MSEFGNQDNHCGDADATLNFMLSYEFVFTLHLMYTILTTTNMLSQALQQKSKDIVNVMSLVSATKTLIQKERDHGWTKQLQDVNTFCQLMEIELPLMNASYGLGRGGQIRPGADDITNEHHCQVDIFNVVLDYQLQELNNRFSEQSVELLILSFALDLKDAFKSYDIDNICNLVETFYPMKFTEHERTLLRYQLVIYEIEVMHHPHFLNMPSMSALCRGLVETNKSVKFYLVDRLIRLVLTLLVSTATTERSFSAMKIVKTTLRNKMDNGFPANTLVCKIEREILKTFAFDSIIKDFESASHRRT